MFSILVFTKWCAERNLGCGFKEAPTPDRVPAAIRSLGSNVISWLNLLAISNFLGRDFLSYLSSHLYADMKISGFLALVGRRNTRIKRCKCVKALSSLLLLILKLNVSVVHV